MRLTALHSGEIGAVYSMMVLKKEQRILQLPHATRLPAVDRHFDKGHKHYNAVVREGPEVS
ncbi:hypothetical protein EJB05_33027 [Eragrostis curvula]|uniref:Uncharacterized protein n=1 Tax=Eragrostis curvula TaxID=38414 RepID=A0A5J9U0D1_9POAL|nr:hypothetical protein EJB05_33027 [Eragrostis curvula]